MDNFRVIIQKAKANAAQRNPTQEAVIEEDSFKQLSKICQAIEIADQAGHSSIYMERPLEPSAHYFLLMQGCLVQQSSRSPGWYITWH